MRTALQSELPTTHERQSIPPNHTPSPKALDYLRNQLDPLLEMSTGMVALRMGLLSSIVEDPTSLDQDTQVRALDYTVSVLANTVAEKVWLGDSGLTHTGDVLSHLLNSGLFNAEQTPSDQVRARVGCVREERC